MGITVDVNYVDEIEKEPEFPCLMEDRGIIFLMTDKSEGVALSNTRLVYKADWHWGTMKKFTGSITLTNEVE